MLSSCDRRRRGSPAIPPRLPVFLHGPCWHMNDTRLERERLPCAHAPHAAFHHFVRPLHPASFGRHAPARHLMVILTNKSMRGSMSLMDMQESRGKCMHQKLRGSPELRCGFNLGNKDLVSFIRMANTWAFGADSQRTLCAIDIARATLVKLNRSFDCLFRSPAYTPYY